jgi:hypothetical protein
MYQSLFNWSQDVEDAPRNAGRDNPVLLRSRIAVCEEALRRFPDEEGERFPLDRMTGVVEALDAAKPTRRPKQAAKVGPNAACPCGSGRKYKKCRGSGSD